MQIVSGQQLARSLVLSFVFRQHIGRRLPSEPRKGYFRCPDREPLQRWWPRGLSVSASFTKMAAGGFRHALPPILFKMSEQRRPPPESECGLMREWLQLRAQAGARWSCATASASVWSWQALSPVGAQKLPPETLKQHSTTFPQVTKIMCAAQGRRRLGPDIVQAHRTRCAGAGGLGWGLPHGRPSPHAPLLRD